MVARLEAETASFHARMAAASVQLNRMGSSGVTARRGVMALQSGLQQLASEAIGLPGALGRVSTGLLSLAGGAGPILLVIAALGALKLAFDAAAKKAEEMQVKLRELRDFRMAHLKLFAELGPPIRLTTTEELQNLTTLRDRALDMIAALTPAPGSENVLQLLGFQATETDPKITALQQSLLRFDRAIADIQGKGFDESLRRMADEAKKFNEQLRLTAEFGSQFARNVGDTRFPQPGPSHLDEMLRIGNIREDRKISGPLTPGATAGGPPPSNVVIDRLGDRLSTAIVSSVFASIAAIRSGSAGGVLAGIGGLIGQIPGGGIIGTIIGGLGTLFGDLFGGDDEERRHREAMNQQERHHREMLDELAGTVSVALPGGGGPFLFDPNDPRQMDGFARMIRELTGRRHVEITVGG
jgi:hypothetical protein